MTHSPASMAHVNDHDMDNMRAGVLHLFARVNCDSYLGAVADSALAFSIPAYVFHGEQVGLAANPGSGALFAHATARTMAAGGSEVPVGKIEKGLVKFMLEGLRWSLGLLETWRKSPPHDESLADRIMAYARSNLVGDLEHLLVKVAKAVAKATIPLFKSTYEFYEALKSCIEGARTRYRVHVAGKGVSVRKGTPALAVGGVLGGLDAALWNRMFDGLVNAGLFILDVASLVATAATGPVLAVSQSIFGVMTSAVSEVARLAIRLYEIYVTREFIVSAKTHDAAVGSPSSIHRDPERFDAWYGAAVQRVPAIAAATIRSGICGDKMRFLQMIDAKGTPMSPSDYRKAFAYLTEIGKQATHVMNQCGVTIRSRDPLIHALFHPAAQCFNETGNPELTRRLSLRLQPRAPGPVVREETLWQSALQGRLGEGLARAYDKSVHGGRSSLRR
ncbi:hypothetical protein P3W23_03045 [Luteibacter sp. PPL554]